MSPEQLFNENQNLVYYCMKRIQVPSMYYEDCIQEGLLALYRACQTFDVDKGYKFATYAVPCIRGAILKFCRDKVSTIHIPRGVWEEGRARELQIGSLDALVNEEQSEVSTFGDLIPSEPDFYPNLFEDTIDDFLKTIPEGRYRNIAEEALYGLAFGDKPDQNDLAVKYGLSQPQVSRLITRAKENFKKFLQEVDRGVNNVK